MITIHQKKKNMKKNDIVLAVAIITLTMMACTQRRQQIAISRPSQQKHDGELQGQDSR